MIQQDLAKLNARLVRLESMASQRPLSGTEIEWGVPRGEEIVATHPITQQGIKAKEVDPRIAAWMRFSEDDA